MNKPNQRNRKQISEQPNKTKSREKSKKDKNNFEIVAGVDQYKNAFRPFFKLGDLDHLQRKISIEAQAISQFKNRENDGNYFLQYNINSFSLMTPFQKNQLMQKIKKAKKKIIDVYEVIVPSNVDRKIKTQMDQEHNRFQQHLVDFQLRSKKILNDIQKSNAKTPFLKKKAQTLPIQEIKRLKFNDIVVDQETNQQDLFQLDIQRLASLKEKSFFMSQTNKINIFKILQDDDCVSPQDHLTKQKFCFNSIVDRNYKLKLPIYRQISSYSRGMITNSYRGKERPLDHVYSDQLTLNIKQLIFVDLMSVASNRIPLEILYSRLYEETKNNLGESMQQQSEQPDMKQIPYRKIHMQKLQDFIGKDEEKQEIMNYKNIPLTNQEKVFKDKYVTFRNDLNDQYEMENRICQNNIIDNRLHNTMGNLSKEKLKRIIRAQKLKDMEQMDKMVRLSKAKSDRKQLLKMKAFNYLLNDKNAKDRVNQLTTRGKLSKILPITPRAPKVPRTPK